MPFTVSHMYRLSNGEAAGGPCSFEIKTEKKKEGPFMTERNANIDYCGIVNLLRALITNGLITEKEARKIAARIAVKNQVDVILFI